jgi:flagellar biosynthesis protein FlhA
LRDPVSGQPLVDPDLASSIAAQIAQLSEQSDAAMALIVQPPVRRTLARLLKHRVPRCLVMSIAELPASQPVDVRAVIGAGTPTEPIHAANGAPQLEAMAA